MSIGSRKVRNGYRNIRLYEAKASLTETLVKTDQQFQSVHDAVMVHAAMFFVYVFIHDSWIAGKPHFDVDFVASVVGSVSSLFRFLVLEAAMLLSAFLVHPCFMGWKSLRGLVPATLVDVSFVCLFAGYVVATGAGLFWTVFSSSLSHLVSLIAGIEQVRLSMKSYSFVRENAYKVLHPWHKDDESGPAMWYAGQMEPQVGSFSSYLYFLFSPTFLYRDRYPRCDGPINWRNALSYFLYFLVTLWYMTVLIRYFIVPSSFQSADLLKSYITALLLSFLLLVILHICVFHAYANFTSELTRFADRQFYGDWWASSSFSSFYRKWNMQVHDWIYSYLYLDIRSVFKSPLLAIFSTLFVSALFHEFLLAISLGYASAMLMVEFAGLGVVFYFLGSFASQRSGNLMVLACLCVGMANLVFYYTVETAARIYCPRPLALSTFFLPRMFECYAEHNS